MESIQRSGDVGSNMAHRYPQGHVVVSISDRRSGVPDTEARQLSSRLMKQFERDVLAVGSVIEGTGFWPSTARSVLTGMNFVSGARYPTAVFSTVVETAAWTAPYLKENGPDVARLAVIIQRARNGGAGS